MSDADDHAESGSQSLSPRRRREARERGQAAKSRMLTASASLLMGAAALSLWGSALMDGVVELMRSSWSESWDPLDHQAAANGAIRQAFSAIAVPASGMMLTILATAVLVHQAQVGGLIVPGLLAPDLSRLRRSSEGDSIWERGLWAVGKTTAACAAGGAVIWLRLPDLLTMGRDSVEFAETAAQGGRLLTEALIWIAAASLGLGGLDYLIQRRKFERMLQSTPQQLREERNDDEGDPALRARRRELARARGEESALASLRGAGLLVNGEGGLTFGVTTGDPRSGGAVIRVFARGQEGHRLRYSARLAGLPSIEALELASRLSEGGAGIRPLRPDELAELKRIASALHR